MNRQPRISILTATGIKVGHTLERMAVKNGLSPDEAVDYAIESLRFLFTGQCNVKVDPNGTPLVVNGSLAWKTKPIGKKGQSLC